MVNDKRRALVSVYDKTGLEDLVRALINAGFEIVSTGNTARHLTAAGFPVTNVQDVTGHPEILDGRVKTLHPRIHGGILCRRGNATDMAEIAEHDIAPIDVVVVNLYPFEKKRDEILAVSRGEEAVRALQEFIDIGGPAMLRASAKSFQDVTVLCDPADYASVAAEFEAGGTSLNTRVKLAGKVFQVTASYDSAIASFFATLADDEAGTLRAEEQRLPSFFSLGLSKLEDLRYGENPHQAAARYAVATRRDDAWYVQHQGKELSFNNLVDTQAALQLLLDLRNVSGPGRVSCAVIKHTNPCGASSGPSALETFERARSCDPVSAFGGIIAIDSVIDEALAGRIVEQFVEVVAAEGFSDEARRIFQTKKNIRLLEVSCAALDRGESVTNPFTVRRCFSEYLLQSNDTVLTLPGEEHVVTSLKPSPSVVWDARFATAVCKHVKSNAIVIVKNHTAIGVGAGQMSRVDSARLAVERAREHGHDVAGSVAASDAFLPFPDTLLLLADAGVEALVQPGGSVKDSEVIAAAEERKIVMFMTKERHFRH